MFRLNSRCKCIVVICNVTTCCSNIATNFSIENIHIVYNKKQKCLKKIGWHHIMSVTSKEWGKIKNGYYDCKLRDRFPWLFYSTTLGQNSDIYSLLFTLCFALPRQRKGESISVHKSSFEQTCSKRYLKNYDMHIYNFNNELKIVIFLPDFSHENVVCRHY